MPKVRGGDIRQLTINGRELSVMAEATVNIDIGGFTNSGNLTGNGGLHINQVRKLAGFSDCSVSIDDEIDDLKYLQNLANEANVVPVTMTLASNITYSGQLAVFGELVKNTNEGSATLEMRGQKFEQI